MDIYDADGYLDRGKVLDMLDEVLAMPRGQGAAAMQERLTALLDECCEGFTASPLDAPTATAEYINMCRPPGSAVPPLDITTGKRVR